LNFFCACTQWLDRRAGWRWLRAICCPDPDTKFPDHIRGWELRQNEQQIDLGDRVRRAIVTGTLFCDTPPIAYTPEDNL
jgi:hypothetical protein